MEKHWTKVTAMKMAKLLAELTGKRHVVLKQGWRFFACECVQAKILVAFGGMAIVDTAKWIKFCLVVL